MRDAEDGSEYGGGIPRAGETPGLEGGMGAIEHGRGVALGDGVGGVAHETDAESLAVGEEPLDFGLPLDRDQIQPLVDECLGVGLGEGSAAGEYVVAVAEVAFLLCGSEYLAALRGAPGASALGDVAQDAGEVAVAGSDLAAAAPEAESSFRLLDVLEGVGAVSADETSRTSGKVVLSVNGREEEAFGSSLGTGLLTLFGDDGLEFGACATLQGVSARAWRGLVNAEEDAEEDLPDGLGERRLAEGRDALGELAGEEGEGTERILDGAEGPLLGRLFGRGAFALRGMLALQGLQGGLGRFRHVGSALIDDGLGPGSIPEGLLEGFSHDPRVLLNVDGEGLPELLLSGSRVLGGHDAQWDAEELPVGGVGHDLDAGGRDLQIEAPFAAGRGMGAWGGTCSGWIRARSWRLDLLSGDGSSDFLPVAERPLGDVQELAESLGGQAVIALEARLSGHELEPAVSWEVAPGIARYEGEQLSKDEAFVLLARGLRRTSEAGGSLERFLERGLKTGTQPAEPARRGAGDRGGELGDGVSEPAAVVGGDDERGDQREVEAWPGYGILR